MLHIWTKGAKYTKTAWLLSVPNVGIESQRMNGTERRPDKDGANPGTPPQRARASHGRRSGVRRPVPIVDATMEECVGVTVDDLADLLTLTAVKNFGPQKFKAVYEKGLKPQELIRNPSLLPIAGKRGDELRRGIASLAVEGDSLFRPRAKRQIAAAHKVGAKIVTYWHDTYPSNVFRSNYPVPVLYVRGSTRVLKERRIVACVGSRRIRSPYSDLHRTFSELAAELDFAVVSGFALGADSIGHETAWQAGKETICVLPGGLERAFPPENKSLWNQLVSYEGAALVSDAQFGTRASSLLLRRRNKLIVAFALGVLVSQTASDGGTMNAYRFAIEQRKPVAVFRADGSKETSGNMKIAEDREADVTVFPDLQSHRRMWEEWLLRLSSSI